MLLKKQCHDASSRCSISVTEFSPIIINTQPTKRTRIEYIYTHTYIHTYIYIHTHTYIHTYPSLLTRVPSVITNQSTYCTLLLFMHSFPGFSRLRMHTKGGSPVAFVEYQDVRYAAQAMATLQGSFLLSSDRGAIRIEYAKSKMAEVGFTNLWIEVGFILCYASRIYKTTVLSTKRNPDENAASLCDTFTPDICIYV